MKNISRKISYLLRHDPEDLIMDKEGWVLTSQLLAKLNIRLTDLEEIVASNDKKRFSFNEDKTKIRANQGHSKKLGLDIKFDEVQFPKTYYHGTARKNVVSIMKSGLHSQTRAYVHLSKDVETARMVGLRHSKDIVILEIDGNQMKRDGFKIYESKNEVILVDHVHSEYIKIKK
jgi:putative RNA 2'-phosphotransferase